MKKVIPLLLASAGLANANTIPADRGILHRAMNEDVWIDINVCSYNWNADHSRDTYNPISNEDIYGCMFVINFWGATSDYVRIVEVSYAQDANEYGADHHTEFLDLETYPIYHQPEVQQVLRNAAHWARQTSIERDACPMIPRERAPETLP